MTSDASDVPIFRFPMPRPVPRATINTEGT